jgi:hypothetical protein
MSLDEQVKEGSLSKKASKLESEIRALARCFSEHEQELTYRVPIDLEKEDRQHTGYCALSDTECPFYVQVKHQGYCRALDRKE